MKCLHTLLRYPQHVETAAEHHKLTVHLLWRAGIQSKSAKISKRLPTTVGFFKGRILQIKMPNVSRETPEGVMQQVRWW